MPAPISNIVVGVASTRDEGPDAPLRGEDPALEPAVELARSTGATLHVVHVLELPDPLLTASVSYTMYPDPGFAERCRAELQEMLEEQVRRFAGVDIRCQAVEGSPARTICRMAREVEADLVVVGATRRGRFWRGLLGTTAERVVRAARKPVLVLHQPFARAIRRVLVATDLSAASGAATLRGVETVRALFGTGPLEQRALMVVWYEAVLPPPLRPEVLQEAAGEQLRRFLHERGLEGMHPRVRTGEVPREIASEAADWGADLLVLGTHGRSGFTRLFLGSVATAALRGSGCNVLVIPAVATDAAPEQEAARVPAEAEPETTAGLV